MNINRTQVGNPPVSAQPRRLAGDRSGLGVVARRRHPGRRHGAQHARRAAASPVATCSTRPASTGSPASGPCCPRRSRPRSARSSLASRPGFCPLSGPVWGAGNILLGGAGSDMLEGRGGDDIIDGDRALTVRISLRTDPADPSHRDRVHGPDGAPADRHLRRPGTAGMTLQQAVFAGLVDPADLVIVRQIDDPTPAPGTVDTAVFSGLRANYDCIDDGVDDVTVRPDLDRCHHAGRAQRRQRRGRHRHHPQHRAAAVRRRRTGRSRRRR